MGIEDFLSTEAINERGNKKLSNALMLASGYKLRYETWQKGYAEMLDE